jgi:predicted ferric reductase
MNKNKYIFWILWLGILTIIPITVLGVTPVSSAIKNPIALTNFIQRIFGLTAFTLMFWQILLGSFMMPLTDKLGGWIYKFHMWEGVSIYSLAVFHPIFFMILNYFGGKGINPFYIFTQICVLCPNQQELYYTLGRVSFWLINITVFAALFRTLTPFLRMNWRKFHVLNYLIFLIIGIHGLSIGTDFMRIPFFTFAIFAYAIILGIVVFKQLPATYRIIKNWLKV